MGRRVAFREISNADFHIRLYWGLRSSNAALFEEGDGVSLVPDCSYCASDLVELFVRNYPQSHRVAR